MKYLKEFILFENLKSHKNLLRDIALDLSDGGLYVNFPDDKKFGRNFYMEIYDEDKLFCKNYPEDDMDWLLGKPVINDFIEKLEDFDLIRDIDYKIYGGGLGVNFVFNNTNKISLY